MPDLVTVTVGVDLSGLFEGRDPWLLAPSYWDEVTRRLLQSAMQAAAGGSQRVPAIANGSHAADSAAELHSTLCMSDQAVSEQSLAVTRCARFCAHIVQHERTASHAALAAVFRHAARSNQLHRGWAGLHDADVYDADVFMRIMIIGRSAVSKSSLLHGLTRARRWLPAIDASRDVRVIGSDIDHDSDAQTEKQHERQLGCCRVV